MDCIFVSMPYARFDSRWFAHVPNINLGIIPPLLGRKGLSVKSFHFHMDFIFHIKQFGREIERNFVRLAQDYGVEYLSLDYVFATLLYEDNYFRSRDRFAHRLKGIGLSLDHFELFRQVAQSFLDDVLARLEVFLPSAKLLGFTCSHYQLSGSLLVSQAVKKRYPALPIVMGGKDCAGPFARELAANVDFVDFVGFGESEVTLDSLLAYLEDPNAPLYNVIYRDHRGSVKVSDSRESGPLDDLPFPEYELEDLPLEAGDVILPVELGRGCPWGRCTFCPDRAYEIKCQSKTTDRVKAEIDHYHNRSSNLRNFFILDSDALKNPQTITALSEYLREKDLSFHFAEFRAERMNRDLIKALLDFGEWVTPFQVGIETFSDRVLRLMDKGVGALKNVEVLKIVAEMGIPLQFNLFTCYPNMTMDDLREILRVMDRIAHILVCENIQFFPGEFYLPADCPVFADIDRYRIQRNSQCLFSDMFDGFPMPSYSNYPYAYAFENAEEQYQMATAVRNKAEELRGKSRKENFMEYRLDGDELKIRACRDGRVREYSLQGMERGIYLYALEEGRHLEKACKELDLPVDTLRIVLDDLEQKYLILYSEDRDAFLSLAMREEG